MHNDEIVKLQEVFSVGALPIKPNSSLTVNELNAWPHLKELHIPSLSAPVELFIGIDNLELFQTLEERRGTSGQPYARRSHKTRH